MGTKRGSKFKHFKKHKGKVSKFSSQELQCFSLWNFYACILRLCRFLIGKIVTPGPILGPQDGVKVYYRNIKVTLKYLLLENYNASICEITIMHTTLDNEGSTVLK